MELTTAQIRQQLHEMEGHVLMPAILSVLDKADRLPCGDERGVLSEVDFLEDMKQTFEDTDAETDVGTEAPISPVYVSPLLHRSGTPLVDRESIDISSNV